MAIDPKKHEMPSQDPKVRAHNFNEVALGYEVDFDEAISRGRMYFDYERHAHDEACNLFKMAENA